MERPSPFPSRTAAITIWENIREGRVAESDIPGSLEGIRKLLTHASRPAKLDEEVWAAFKRFVIQSDTAQLRLLVTRFEWSVGLPDVEKLQHAVRLALIEFGLSPHFDHAAELHARLFLHLLGVVSRPGRKTIQKSDATDLAELPGLPEHERSLLNLVTSEIFRLDARLGDVEAKLDQHALAISTLQLGLKRFADSETATPDIVDRLPELSLSAPPLVQFSCSRAATVNTLMNGAIRRTWTALHGSAGSGKTQLLLLLAARISTSTVHVSLRDLSEVQAVMRILVAIARIAESETLLFTDHDINAAIDNLSEGSQLLIDDLPRLDGKNELSRLLMSLAILCSRRNILLLTNSHHPLPSGILESLKAGMVESIPVPPFNVAESEELFTAYGAPERFRESGIFSRVCAIAAGNGTLLAAYARSFAERNWELDSSDFELTSMDPSGVIGETVNRLLLTVADDDARDLLYRLCHVIGQFGREQIQVVASVPPIINRPQERLSKLTGIWVEEYGHGRSSVSPLVKQLGESELTEAVAKGVNLGLANAITGSKRINVFDAVEATHYFRKSGDPNRLGLFMMNALASSLSLPIRELAILYAATGADSELTDEMDLGLRILVRAKQVLVADRLNLPLEQVLNELEHLMDEGGDSDKWAVFVAALTSSWIAAKESLIRGLKFCRTAIDLHAEVLSLVSDIRDQLPPSQPVEENDRSDYVWLNLSGVQTSTDVLAWLDFLGDLPDEFLDNVFASMHAEMGAIVIADKPWMSEIEKPVDERNWPSVLSVVERVADFAATRRIETLWAAAVRSLIVIQAEYVGEFDQAVELGRESLANDIGNERSRFLINDIVGRQYVYARRNSEAVPWLEAALSESNQSYPTIRVRTYLELARAVGSTNPTQAVQLCRRAVGLAKSDPQAVPELEVAASLAELALAEYLDSQDAKKAFEPCDEAARILLDCKDESPVWKQRFTALGHAVSYLASVATRGAPPSQTMEGDEYAAPTRGCLMSPNERLSEVYDEGDYRVRSQSLFPSLMTTFAEAAGRLDKGVEWALNGLEDARRSGVVEAISLLGQHVFPLLVRDGRIREAIDVSMESCSAMTAKRMLQDNDAPTLRVGVNINDVLGNMPNDNWKLAESWAADHGIFPAVLEIGRIFLSDPSRATEYARELIEVCNEIGEFATDSQLWLQCARTIGSIFIDPLSAEELHEAAGEALKSGQRTAHRLGYLGCTVVRDAVIERSVVYHGVIFHHLFMTMRPCSPVYHRLAIPFLAEYWQSEFTHQRFRFRMPSIVERQLTEVAELPMEVRAQRILSAVTFGLGVSLPSNLSEVSEWIRQNNETN
ncbi:MAG: ATP-binding protein [Pirellulaceae bacterium]